MKSTKGSGFLRLLSERVIGERSFSLATFLIVVLPASFLSVVADPSTNSTYLITWIAVVCAAGVISGVFFIAYGRIVFPLVRGTSRIFFTFLGYALTGFIRGGLLGVLGLASGIVTEVNWQFRLGGGSLVAIVLLPVAATLINDVYRYRTHLNELTASQKRLSELTVNAQAELDAERVNLLESIHSRISDAVKTISQNAGPGQSVESYRSLVTNLLSVAETVVRPLSRQILEGTQRQDIPQQEASLSKTSVTSWLKASTLSQPFRPLPVTLIWAVIGASTITSLKPGFPGVLSYPLFVLSTGLILYFAKRLISPRLPSLSIPARVMAITGGYVVAGIIPAILSWLPLAELQRAGFGSLRLTLLVLDPLATFFMCVTLALLAGLKTERDKILSQLEKTNMNLQWKLASLRGLLRAQRMELSRSVHGDVQSVFIAVALKLQTAIAAGNVSETVLEEIRTELDALTNFTVGAKEYPSIEKAVEELRQLWGDSLSIELSLDEAAQKATQEHDVLRAMLIDVCSEAVTNAVKHGSAQRVRISLSANASTLTVSVFNDGAQLNLERVSGEGFRLINEVAISSTLVNTDEGVMLTLQLPIPG